MKHILTLILLITYSISFAQTDLYISDNANVYMYVDGTAFTGGTNAPLYVTNGIQLVGEGNLYLRNEAHLLQGSTGNNSGTGRLSVFQTGNSNTYMYNYWGSPVGQNIGTAGNTFLQPSNNLYRETTAPITSTAYTYVSDYNGTATEIASYWLYSFLGITAAPNDYQHWLGIGRGALPVGADPDGTLAPGYGFTMKGSPTGTRQYDFRGRPNNGTITVTLNPNRETLVGNPYPSAIDALEFIHDPSNTNIANEYDPILFPHMTGVLKYWEQRAGATSHVLSNYVGGYALYTISSDGATESFVHAPFSMYNLDGTPAGGPPSGDTDGVKTPRRYIPVGQGFMVEGTASATSV